MEPCFPGLNTCLLMESRNEFHVLLCLVCVQSFLCLLNCVYLKPWVFLLEPFWFTPSLVEERVISCVGLRCWLGLNHDIELLTYIFSSSREHQYLFTLDLLLTLHMEVLLFWQIKLLLN